MKIRPSIIFFTAIMVALIALILWHLKKRPAATLLIETIQTNVFPSTAISTYSGSNAPILKTKGSVNSSISQSMSKTQRAIGLLSDYNDQPIVFYGKIEDQFSNAVANATVNFGVRIMNGRESTVKSGQLTSDDNGLFTISGYNGQNLGIGVKKLGYVWVSMNGSGIYSKLWPEDQRAHPDPYNPTIIKMWKLQGAEPLINISRTLKISYTDRPINFDLVTDEIVPTGGDLVITANRPSGLISGRNPQDWSIGIHVVDGGFIETSEENASVTYAAPENGYQANGVFHKNNGPNLVDKMFFIQSRNGQIYTKIHILFSINKTSDDFMYITLKGVANTNSSQNWEATAPQ